jgi:inositol-phosphate transport system permease protein
MSSTGAATVALPASKSKIWGQIIAISGAVLVLITFFMPWIALKDHVKVLASLSGWQIANGTVLASSEGRILFRGSPVYYIVPLICAVVLVMVLFAFRRGYVRKWDALGIMALGVVSILLLWGIFQGAGRTASQGGVILGFQFGMIGVWLGLVGLVIAGVLDVRAVIERDPTFRGTLGAWGFMSPAMFLVTIFFFIPAILLLILSMTDLSSSNFSRPWNFVELANYRRMFSDQFFPKILANTFRYVIFTLAFFNVGLALLLALITSHINRQAGFFFRMLWLLPRITPSVVYIVMWRRIIQQPPFGIFNQFLGLIGVERQPYWLVEAPWVFVILVNGFVGASFGMIIFSSAIEVIPRDLITAAKVDGASTLQVIRDITLPLLKWPLLFVTSYQTLSLLVSFEYILLLTEGGPGLFTTEVWALTAYKRALFTYFGSNQWGYGAAWGFVLVVIAIAASVVYLRVFRFNDLVQEPKIDVL